MSALFATAMLLFFFILALNLFVIHATHRREK
jgi:ABC-type phosphate transport system permease subunit